MFRTRFAPSPTGYLHLGHIASAALAYGMAAKNNGTCLLRIEDIDTRRSRPEYEAGIYQDLHWLGFINSAEPDQILPPVRRQSDHFSDYQKQIEILRGRGLVYPCFQTRKEILADSVRAPHGMGHVYTGPKHPLSGDEIQTKIEGGQAYAWRLSMRVCRDILGVEFDQLSFRNNGQTVAAIPDQLGDVILGRKDAMTSYHLASCFDDAHAEITDIIRGKDLLASTHVHVLLQTLMGWSTPLYHHHELLCDENGKRLAKRDQAAAIRAMREDGIDAQNVLARVRNLR